MRDVSNVRVRIRADVFKAMVARRNETLAETFRASAINYDNGLRFLSGKNSPGPAARKKLLAHFGVGFDDLFEIVDDRPLEAAT